jgi:adenosine kinase
LRFSSHESYLFTSFLTSDKERTGTCAVLISDKERTLVANLGAANLYDIKHLESKEIQALIKRAKFFYVTGFFLTVSPQSLVKLGQHACEENKVRFQLSERV